MILLTFKVSDGLLSSHILLVERVRILRTQSHTGGTTRFSLKEPNVLGVDEQHRGIGPSKISTITSVLRKNWAEKSKGLSEIVGKIYAQR